MNPWVRICTSLYRRLARAYPHEFRMICGDEMERLGEDAAPEIWRRHGFSGLLRLVADIAMRLPAEYATELRQDVRYAARRLRQSPGFTTVAVLSLGMGIGVCVIFFAQMHTMHQPIPGISDPGELVVVEQSASYPYFESYREQREIAKEATAFIGMVPFSIATGGSGERAERVSGQLVAVNYFDALGVTPLAGRVFHPQTEKPGSEPTVVVSERFWRTHLNSDPQAVGSILGINGQSAKVAGIAPKGFRGMAPMPPSDLFMPLTVAPAIAPELRDNALQNPDFERFRVVLRLAEGVTAPAAEAALDVVTRTLDQQKPDGDKERDRRATKLLDASGMFPMTAEQRRVSYGMNLLLLTMVLMLACANLAILLLARGSQRQREIAVRLSVGASRFRLVRQLLTESVILALLGGAVGLGLFLAVIEASKSLAIYAEMGLESQVDSTVVGFTLVAALAAAAGFGLTPALASARTDVVTALKEGGLARLRGYRRFGVRNLFVVYQVAASLMLLLITGYVVVGYQRSTGIDPGFNTSNLYLFSLDPIRDGYSPERSARLLEQLPRRLSQLEEVQHIAIADRIPFGEMVVGANTPVSVPTTEGEAELAIHKVFELGVGAGFFATLHVPLVRGREFAEHDLRPVEPSSTGSLGSLVPTPAASSQTATPVVLNQTAARQLFGDNESIGTQIRQGEKTYAVIGVAQDVKSGFMMANPVPTVFLPLSTDTLNHGSRATTVLMRGMPGRDSMSALRTEMNSIDSALTIFDARTMDDHLGRFNEMIQWSSVVNGGIGVFGLILSSIGLAAVTSYSVARRRKEIGIRMALGAKRLQVLRLVMKEGTVLVVVGGVVGFLGAWAFAQAVSSITAEFAKVVATGTDDPLLVVGGPMLVLTLAFIACYLPARRSTKIDPLVALREE